MIGLMMWIVLLLAIDEAYYRVRTTNGAWES